MQRAHAILHCDKYETWTVHMYVCSKCQAILQSVQFSYVLALLLCGGGAIKPQLICRISIGTNLKCFLPSVINLFTMCRQRYRYRYRYRNVGLFCISSAVAHPHTHCMCAACSAHLVRLVCQTKSTVISQD